MICSFYGQKYTDEFTHSDLNIANSILVYASCKNNMVAFHTRYLSRSFCDKHENNVYRTWCVLTHTAISLASPDFKQPKIHTLWCTGDSHHRDMQRIEHDLSINHTEDQQHTKMSRRKIFLQSNVFKRNYPGAN